MNRRNFLSLSATFLGVAAVSLIAKRANAQEAPAPAASAPEEGRNPDSTKKKKKKHKKKHKSS